MLFADNIVLVDKSRDDMTAKLERWREALESKVFKICSTKIEYMDCHCNGYIQRATSTIRIEAQEILQRDSFRYLRSIISKDGDIDEDVE